MRPRKKEKVSIIIADDDDFIYILKQVMLMLSLYLMIDEKSFKDKDHLSQTTLFEN